MFRRIFIANRGEVVPRVLKTAARLGVEAVVAYSRADAEAPYLSETEGVCVGPASSARSYLDKAALIQAARQKRCAAVHPGWGFLAENAEFAAMCRQHGLTFIGPAPGIIDLMGKKTPAKEAMERLGLQGVPGSGKLITSAEEALAEAAGVGYPLMVKAESGGGGRGMRICRDEAELRHKVEEASQEAQAAFADPRLYLERYVERGRHIESQVLVDRFGKALVLGERECSVQRKHQKLIEESPSPALNDDDRRKLEAAVGQACSALGYEGAGTVEFLRSRQGEMFFIEMNTRLQVEHPVTEMIFGLDLVEQQMRIAAGQRLGDELGQERRGHAIECRINAEDPELDFKPSPGTITAWSPPSGEGIRVDSHVAAGYAVPPFYDSLLAKLIVHDEDRPKAIAKMEAALEAFKVEGVKTTIPFHRKVLAHPAFRSGDYDTALLEDMLGEGGR